jgi:alkylated DNA repair dioxygenase AlkB
MHGRPVGMARKNDSTMPEMNCTHVLLNMCTNRDGLVWHRDIYGNDGRSDHPVVVILSVGAPRVFGVKHNEDDVERKVNLRDGDC